jgi:hypothetical protein
VARFISGKKKNQVKSVWEKFESLDLFTRLFVITLLLLVISTPFVVYNYQLYTARGESQTERLREIGELRGYQSNLKNALARSGTETDGSNLSSEKTDASTPNPGAGFNLIDMLQRFLMNIAGLFIKVK